MPAALRLRWRGHAWFEHAGLPASRGCGAPVSVRLAVSGWAGDGAGRFAGVRGRRADPRWLSDRWPFAWSACRSAVWAHALVRRRGTRAARAWLSVAQWGLDQA